MSHPNNTPRTPTQVAHPWRATVRTTLAALVTLAAIAPLIYSAAAERDPGQATGWAGVGLVICGAVTRVMSLPAVNGFLATFVPWLAPTPPQEGI